MEELAAVTRLSDAELVAALKRAVQNERESVADVIAHLIEFNRRRLHAAEGFPSLFHYCTRELVYAEEAAYKRIRAAHAAEKFPIILRLLRQGRLHLGAIVALHAHLTPGNHRELLERAAGLSARELEFMVAGLAPRPDKMDCVRRLTPPDDPQASSHEQELPACGLQGAAPAERGDRQAFEWPLPTQDIPPTPSAIRIRSNDLTEPLSAERVRIAFTAGREVLDKLDRARSLLRHRYPDGRLEAVFADALDALLRRIDPEVRLKEINRRRAAQRSSATSSRRIPQSARAEVWRRDGGRCTFLTPSGTRCEARSGLEIDHIQPWSLGGRSDDPRNLRLLCRAHNLLLARRIFGHHIVGARQPERP